MHTAAIGFKANLRGEGGETPARWGVWGEEQTPLNKIKKSTIHITCIIINSTTLTAYIIIIRVGGWVWGCGGLPPHWRR